MDWEQHQLGEFCRIRHGFAFKGEFFADDGTHIVVTPGNFFEEGGFRERDDSEKFYTADFPQEYLLRSGDLILVMTEQAEGLLGSAALVPRDNRFLHNQRIGLVIDLDETRLDRRFLYHLFNTREVRAQISASANGVKVRHTSPGRILQARARIPSIQTQREIARVSAAYDNLLKNNRQRITLLEELIRRLYSQWFARVDSTSWPTVPLGDLAEVNSAMLSPKAAPAEIEYVDISSVGIGAINETTHYSFADAPGRARRIVRPGDILWSCVRPNRRSHALVLHPSSNMIASTGFAVLTPVRVPPSWLLPAVTTDEFVAYLGNHAKGAAYPAVTGKDFGQAPVVLPPAELLAEWDALALPMLEQCHTLREQCRQLRAARDLLLPRLMDGRIRV